jgi:hypothetical protein
VTSVTSALYSSIRHRHGLSTMSQARTISGTIRFQDVSRPARDVTVYVRVEETSRLDAPASRVAEVVLRGVSILAGSPPLPFTVPDVVPVPSGRYVVRVHADVDGDGQVSRGDYVSKQSHPVLASADPDVVAVVAHEVR